MSVYFSPTSLFLFILPWAPLLVHSSIYSKPLSWCAFYSNHQHYFKDLCSFLDEWKLQELRKWWTDWGIWACCSWGIWLGLQNVSLPLLRPGSYRWQVWQYVFFFFNSCALNLQESLVIWCCVNPSACPELRFLKHQGVCLKYLLTGDTRLKRPYSYVNNRPEKSQKIDDKINCWFILLLLLKLCLLKNPIAASMKY